MNAASRVNSRITTLNAWVFGGILVTLATLGLCIAILVGMKTAKSDLDSASAALAVLFSQQALTLDPLCDDGNECTWDFMKGDGLHCEHIAAKNNESCTDPCLVDDASRLCAAGQCTGSCAGNCDIDADCPDLPAHPFIPVVDIGGAGTCYNGKCVYAYFTVNNVIPTLPCLAYTDTQSERGCTDLISRLTPNTGCMQSTYCQSLFGGTCLFSYQCSRFNFGSELIAQGEEAPVVGNFTADHPGFADIVAFIADQNNVTVPE